MHLLSLFRQPRELGHVFVFGCGHSGTSLVAAMLGAHSQIYAIPFETNAFLGDNTNAEARTIISVAGDARDKSARLVCEKTPMHIHHVERMAETFPGAQFVLCLRDPRDVACSIKRRSGKLQDGIDRWWKDNTVAASLISRLDCFTLRYEDLIAEPKPTLKRLCDFLGLRYQAGMMNFWQDDREWFGTTQRRDTNGQGSLNHKIRRNWQIHQPLMLDRVGVWKRELTNDEITAIEGQTSSLASSLGYSMATVRGS